MIHGLGKSELQVQQCGLVLYPVYQYLGASPHGQVYNPNSFRTHGLLETKCPLTAFDQDLAPGKTSKDPAFFCELVEQKVYLKESDKYYTLVEGQLAMTSLACRV